MPSFLTTQGLAQNRALVKYFLVWWAGTGITEGGVF